MGKRGADKQITQDDDDALLGGNNEGIAGCSFRKATAETISKRRILKTSSKWKQARPSGGGVGNPKPGGAFSGFNFGSSYSNKATPQPKSTDRPLFAMPTLPETSALAPTIGTTNAPNFSSTSVNDSTSSNDEAVAKLVEGFKSYINKMGGKRLSLELPVSRFMTTYLELTRKPKLADMETKEAAKSSSSSSSAEKTSKPLFPSVTSSKPSPVPFSFPASAGAPALSFSAAKANTTTTAAPTTTTTSVSSPAPAPFSFASKSPPVAPISAPATAASSSIASSEKSEEKEESTVLEEGDADKDWKTVHHEGKVAVYHYRAKNDKGEDVITKFAGGGIKLQKHKQEDGNRRMVMRNVTGKVILNLSISGDMTFEKRMGKKNDARVMFYGCRDADYGNELLLIRCRKENVDAFHAKLVGMTK